MRDIPLTQEEIDCGFDENGDEEKRGLFAKAAQHPFLTGGLVLAGAGLAYAAVKVVKPDQIAREVHIETSVTIGKTPQELYSFWREFQNLPLFMKNLDHVRDLGNGNWRWVAKGLGSSPIEWDAEIYNEIPNQLIAWRSLENADVVNAGSVRFEKAPGDHGTYVRVTVNYNPPGGKIGSSLVQLFGAEPKQLIREDLRRFKQLMETGEIATIDGQTSGRAAEDEEETMSQSNATEKGTDEQLPDDARRGAKAATGNVEHGTQHQPGPQQGEGSTPTSATNVEEENREHEPQHSAA